MAHLRLSVRKIDITPRNPVSLLGYFNKRISTGVRDNLYCRIARLSLEGGGVPSKSPPEKRELLFIGVDTCYILKEDADRIKTGVKKKTGIPTGRVMIFATHTHTAPALGRFFETEKEHAYLGELEEKILDAVSHLDDGLPVNVRAASRVHSALCYNRRWFMKDGSVATNPPKLSPLRDRPEGPVDREVRVVLFFAGNAAGVPVALFVNISNHTDTVGGSGVSADWPGFLELSVNRELKKKFPGMAEDVPVFTFLAPQGNINHFDFDSPGGQTGYAEAERLGQAYAGIVLESIPDARQVAVETLGSRYREVGIPPCEISEADLERARSLVAESGRARPKADYGIGGRDKPRADPGTAPFTSAGVNGSDLTSEDIVRGDPRVERLFAQALLKFSRTIPMSYPVPLQVLEAGPVTFCGVPGEPFVEIGLALKTIDESRFVIPVALANGYFGYIPLEGCFERGGYEVKPGGSALLSRLAAGIILEEIKNLLKKGPTFH